MAAGAAGAVFAGSALAAGAAAAGAGAGAAVLAGSALAGAAIGVLAPLTEMSGFSLSNVASPMPFTFLMSSIDLNGPFALR